DRVSSTGQCPGGSSGPWPGGGCWGCGEGGAQGGRQRRARDQTPGRLGVRGRAPAGITGQVQPWSGRVIYIGRDGTVEMSVADAQPLIRSGWTKLEEWTREDEEV